MSPLGTLPIRDLEAILVLARTLHFGRAAEEAGLAQASLSALVRRVEVALGVRLFDRTSRRCAITPQGVFVVESIEKLLRMVDDLGRARERPDSVAGAVRLGFIPTLGPYLLPQLLPAWTAAFPEARFFFFEALTDELMGMLHARRLDAAFLSFPRRVDALAEFPLFEEELVLALPAGHPLAERERIPRHEAPCRELILMDHGNCLRDHTVQICGKSAAGTSPVHSTSLETLRFMVAAGVGCAVLPALAVHGHPAAAELIAYRRFADPVPTRAIGLLTRDDAEARRLAAPLAEVASGVALPRWG